MLQRVVRTIQTDEPRGVVFVGSGQSKLSVDDAKARFAGAAERLVRVRALQDEVHTGAVTELAKEGQELECFILLHHLNTCRVGFPFFVDGNNCHPPRNSKRSGYPR